MDTKSVASFRLSNGGCGEPFRNKRPIHHTRLNMMYRYNPMTYTNTGRSVIVVFLIRNCHIPIKDNAKTLSQNMYVDCSTLQKYKIFLQCTRRMKIISLGVSLKEALDMFYKSETCRRFHDEETGLYLQGNLYVLNDFLAEISA